MRIRILLFLLFFCSSVFAGSIKEIVVFGDSLTDDGRLYAALGFVPKSPPYYKGRFSNGPTWAEHVGQFFYNKSYIDTKIYAWGGATAMLHNPLHDSFIAPIELNTEIFTYFANSLFTDKTQTLYIIWIGANDYLYDRQVNKEGLVKDVVDQIYAAITLLMMQHAQNFMIMNLPDLSMTPYAVNHNITARLDQLTRLHNQKLLETVNQLRKANPKLNFIFYDTYSSFSDLLNNPKKYNQTFGVNIRNTKDACWKGSVMLNRLPQQMTLEKDVQALLVKEGMGQHKNANLKAVSSVIANSPSLASAYFTGMSYKDGMVPCSNASQYIFWDELHPTEVVHSVLAQLVEKTLSEQGL